MRVRAAEETDWERIVLLYDALMQTTPSPIVALNRAVAVSMAHGPAAGLKRSMPWLHLQLTRR
jgi:predicted RNA polymerase sigma factor